MPTCRFCPRRSTDVADFISLHDSAYFGDGGDVPLTEVVLELCQAPLGAADEGPQQICRQACLPRLTDCFLFCRQIRQAEEQWARTRPPEADFKIEIGNSQEEYEAEFLIDEEDDERDNATERDESGKDANEEDFSLPPEEMIRTRLEYNNFDYMEYEGEKCCGCGAFLKSREDLESHTNKVHSNNGQNNGEKWQCSVCKSGFNSSEDLEQHTQQFKAKHIFYCKLCLKGFYNKGEFLVHMDVHKQVDDESEENSTNQDKASDYKAEKDTQESVNTPERKPHGQRFVTKLPNQKLISSVKDYEQFQIIRVDNAERCCGCGVYFETFEELMQHARLQHQSNHKTQPEGYSCEVCFEQFKAPWALCAHTTLCRLVQELYHCKLCQLTYVRKYHLAKHFSRTPGHLDKEGILNDSVTLKPSKQRSKPELHCCFPKCLYSCKTEKQLLGHIEELHAPRRKLNITERSNDDYVCNMCQRSFGSQQLLKFHRNRGTKKRYMCSFCAERFVGPSKLKEHELLSHHDVVPEHHCDICSKAFRTKNLLTAHRRTHDTERNFPCEQCPAMFRLRLQLRKHMRGVHPTCFPYECQYCEKKFPTKTKYDLHLRSHTGDRPYQCRYESCGKQFSHVTDRRRHEMGVHTEERPYQCDRCSRGFIRKRELLMHQQKHKRAAN